MRNGPYNYLFLVTALEIQNLICHWKKKHEFHIMQGKSWILSIGYRKKSPILSVGYTKKREFHKIADLSDAKKKLNSPTDRAK